MAFQAGQVPKASELNELGGTFTAGQKIRDTELDALGTVDFTAGEKLRASKLRELADEVAA